MLKSPLSTYTLVRIYFELPQQLYTYLGQATCTMHLTIKTFSTIFRSLFMSQNHRWPSHLKFGKTIEKPSMSMVSLMKNIQWWWSSGGKTIEKPLKKSLPSHVFKKLPSSKSILCFEPQSSCLSLLRLRTEETVKVMYYYFPLTSTYIGAEGSCQSCIKVKL